MKPIVCCIYLGHIMWGKQIHAGFLWENLLVSIFFAVWETDRKILN